MNLVGHDVMMTTEWWQTVRNDIEETARNSSDISFVSGQKHDYGGAVNVAMGNFIF